MQINFHIIFLKELSRKMFFKGLHCLQGTRTEKKKLEKIEKFNMVYITDIFFYIILFIFGCGSSLWCTASHCSGFSRCGAQALGTWQVSVGAARRLSSCGMQALERTGLSSCGSRAIECRLSSCGSWTLLLRSMWDLPGPGLEPMSPALAGGFLTSVPPGKSLL